MSHMTEHVGRVLGGRYRLLSPLGSGASAEVYLADDVRLRRRVAVKLLQPALAHDEGFLRRFRAEARAAAALSHPNILAVYDWNGDEQPYLVTEHLRGGSLRAMLDAGHRLSPSQALVVGLQAAQALDVAHRQGFVHRDVKPANILFGGDSRLRVADFGLARAVAEAAVTEPTGAVTGLARYVSPEQARGEALTGHSDIYSLSLVLIEAVTGHVPFAAATTVSTLTARMDRPVEVPEELAGLGPVVATMGAVLPTDRPDAATVVTRLMDAATQLPRPAPLPLTGQAPLRGAPGDDEDHTIVASADAPPAAPAQPGPASHAGVPATAPAGAVPIPPGQAHPGSDDALPAAVPPKRAGRRRVLPSWVIPTLAVAFALAVGAGGVWFLREASVPSYQVPDVLVGSQISDINNHVGDYGWRIDQQDEHAPDTEPGEILRTRPQPGDQLREGETLEVVVSLGPPPVALPQDLQDLPEDEGRTRLEDRGFEVDVSREDHETIEDGHVIGYGPETPRELPEGSTVDLVVSDGPPWPTIPPVTGMPWQEARDTLRGLDLDVRPEETEPEDDEEPGTVLGTDPGAGSEVEPGTEVTVHVAREDDDDGGWALVPNVEGSSVDDAEDTLEDRGLEVGEVRGSGDTVRRQDPGPWSVVSGDTEVDLHT